MDARLLGGWYVYTMTMTDGTQGGGAGSRTVRPTCMISHLLEIVPNGAIQEIRAKELELEAGIHAVCHALTNLLPCRVLCGPSDINTEHKSQYQSRVRPARCV